jgi:hypothetical protein
MTHNWSFIFTIFITQIKKLLLWQTTCSKTSQVIPVQYPTILCHSQCTLSDIQKFKKKTKK